MIKYLGNDLNEMIDNRIWPFLDLQSMGYGVEGCPTSDPFDNGTDLAGFLVRPHRCAELLVARQHEYIARSLVTTNHNIRLLVCDCRLHLLDRCGRSGQRCNSLSDKGCNAGLPSQFATWTIRY